MRGASTLRVGPTPTRRPILGFDRPSSSIWSEAGALVAKLGAYGPPTAGLPDVWSVSFYPNGAVSRRPLPVAVAFFGSCTAPRGSLAARPGLASEITTVVTAADAKDPEGGSTMRGTGEMARA